MIAEVMEAPAFTRGVLTMAVEPIMRSELLRIEELVGALKQKVYELEKLSVNLESYQNVTLKLASELGVLHKTMPRMSADPMKIVMRVCSSFRLPVETLMQRNRTKLVAQARAASIYLCFDLLGIGEPELARIFKRHQGSVYHAKKMVATAMAGGSSFGRKVKAIRKSILESLGGATND